MCGSMADIQSATAEIRRGKKDTPKKPHGKNIMSTSAMQGGHKKVAIFETRCVLMSVCLLLLYYTIGPTIRLDISMHLKK